MSKAWLITGSGNGLGRDIAEAALAAGDSVVAGARRTEELAPLAAQHGERVKPVKLEVRRSRSKSGRAVGSRDIRAAGRCGEQRSLWAVCAVRADEYGGLPGDRGHMLLRRGVHHARRGAGDL